MYKNYVIFSLFLNFFSFLLLLLLQMNFITIQMSCPQNCHALTKSKLMMGTKAILQKRDISSMCLSADCQSRVICWLAINVFTGRIVSHSSCSKYNKIINILLYCYNCYKVILVQILKYKYSSKGINVYIFRYNIYYKTYK